MQVTLKLTNHNWTQEKQYEKFLEELEEFYSALEEFKAYGNKRERYDLYVIDEGFDVCKSLQKWNIQESRYCLNEFEIITFGTDSRDLYSVFQAHLDDVREFGESLSNNSAMIIGLLNYLLRLCEENNLDFSELLKKNDEKNERKGVKEKVYLEKGDKEMFGNLTYFESLPDEYIERLKSLINRIEE